MRSFECSNEMHSSIATSRSHEPIPNNSTHAEHEARKSVTFGSIEIREYELALGDNLACLKGPPLTIGENYIKQERINLDTYEDKRGARRSRIQLKVEPSHRRELLIFVYGYSERTIFEREIELARERRLRQGKQCLNQLDHPNKRAVANIQPDRRVKRRCLVRRHTYAH